MKKPIQTYKTLERQVAEWNQSYPPGTAVVVLLDDGSQRTTKTRSIAWVMGGHTAVVKIEGIAGGYLLDRVRPVE